MRIVYDTGAVDPRLPRVPPGGEGRRVDVLVIKTDKAPQESGGVRVSGEGYELRISEEALARDREVRGHEQKHLAALGGAAAGPILYDTVTGPDGRSIAVGGRIAVDLEEVSGDPAATLRKANAVLAAARAPGDPSAADLRVAARADRLAQKARAELRDEAEGVTPPREGPPGPS